MTKKLKKPKSPVTKLARRHPDSVVLADGEKAKRSAADERIALLEKQVQDLQRPRLNVTVMALSTPAKTLLHDAKDAIARGLAQITVRGQTSIRFDLDDDTEVAGARELEMQGYGKLSLEGAKAGTAGAAPEVTCAVHGKPYPCSLGQKRLGDGGQRGVAPDPTDQVCRFGKPTGGDVGWVFEFTRIDDGPHRDGVLHGSSIDEDN